LVEKPIEFRSMRDTSFPDFILDQLHEWSYDVEVKKMFGGFGLFCDKIMFALISADGELFLKTDEENRFLFEKIGSHPFSYNRSNKKKVSLSYWYVPENILEDSLRLIQFTESAYGAALRNQH